MKRLVVPLMRRSIDGAAAGGPMIGDAIAQLPLLDHHAHGVTTEDLTVQRMGDILNESSSDSLGGQVAFEKPVGLNIRSLCAPVLGLPPHVPIETYLDRRREIGGLEATRLLLEKCGHSSVLLDTYDRLPSNLTPPEQFSQISGVPTHEVLRIESIFENVAMQNPDKANLFDVFADTLLTLSQQDACVGLKSIIGYRTGFAMNSENPTDVEVAEALEDWRRTAPDGSRPRLAHPVLCRRVLWTAAELAKSQKLPLQLHVGIGDDDVDMPSNDPGHLKCFFDATQKLGVNITLLHCYPYVRTAQWLSDIYANVYYDIGFMLAFGSREIDRLMREAFEIGPFHKMLYSSDAFQLAELYYISAMRFRRLLARLLQDWIDDGFCGPDDALKIARGICNDNAASLYRLSSDR